MRISSELTAACCIIWFSAPGIGCICSPPPPPAVKTIRDLAAWRLKSPNDTDVIFEGVVERQQIVPGPIRPPKNVVSITLSPTHRIVTIRASRIYRGPKLQGFTVLTGMGIGDCGFDFEAGRKYLVFADAADAGNFFTSICTGTTKLEQAGPSLRLLRGEAPAPEDLLDQGKYYEDVLPRWTGGVCGRVNKPDGQPLGGAMVTLWQFRDEPLPSRTADDPNGSKPDGSFCIKNVDPGRYLLVAEKTYYDSWTRLMGFYPGVAKRTLASVLEVRPGITSHDLQFSLSEEALYRVRIKAVLLDGSPLPWKNPWEHVMVAIDSPDQDPLAYHQNHGVEEDGSYTFSYIPAGRYTFATYINPADTSAWQPAKEEVDIAGNTEVVLKLLPAK